MAYLASHKFARIAPRKVRLVTDMIRGMPADEALTSLEFCKKRGAVFVRDVLKSAIANAEENDVDPGSLVVSLSKADGGPTLKRFQQKDRGRAHPIRKRTSHITVAVDVNDRARG